MCGSCGAAFEVEVFPAHFRGIVPVAGGDPLQAEGEASCFYHPGKRAVVVCASCGRFLCSLCDIALGGKNLCPTCVERGISREELTDLVTRRTLYDTIALSLAFLPMFFIFPTLLTAPTALYVAVRRWKSVSSLVPRTRFRFVLAIGLAGLQCVGWGMLFVKLLR